MFIIFLKIRLRKVRWIVRKIPRHGPALRYRRDRDFAMSAVPSADERYSFETDGFLVVESILGCDHVARLREALQRAIARCRELERRGTPHFAAG